MVNSPQSLRVSRATVFTPSLSYCVCVCTYVCMYVVVLDRFRKLSDLEFGLVNSVKCNSWLLT